MAWEEESIEGGADFEEMGGKKSPIKMILMIVIGLIVLVGGGYAVYAFVLKDKPEEEAATVEGEAETPPPEPEIETGFLVTLDKFTLNLAGTGGADRFLVTTIGLEVSTEELKTDLSDDGDTKLYKIKTRNEVLAILRSKTYKEMSDPATSKEIAKEIQFKLNRVYKTGAVMNVYFSELIVQ